MFSARALHLGYVIPIESSERGIDVFGRVDRRPFSFIRFGLLRMTEYEYDGC